MANRSESSQARSWGRRVHAIQNSQVDLDRQLQDADDLDLYEELLKSQAPIEARLRIATNQLIDRLERRFPGETVAVLESIYGDSDAEQDTLTTESAFDRLWSSFHNQDPNKAALLMEERILPYFYGILQPDSSFPDGE